MDVHETKRQKDCVRPDSRSSSGAAAKFFRLDTFTAGVLTKNMWLEDGTTKHGVLLGYEQPVTKRISFLADWASGNNDYGYVVAGTGITLSTKDSF